MKSYTADNIINIAVTGHAGTGKTILSESMLFNSNAIRTMGSIESGSTVSDYNDFESSSQHSISLSVLTFEHMDKKINMIDVPGYIDFIGELKSAIKVSDCILNVISSTDGVMISIDAGTAAYNLADGIFVGPSQTWFGRLPNVTVADLHAISSDIGDAGDASANVIVAALLDDVA